MRCLSQPQRRRNRSSLFMSFAVNVVETDCSSLTVILRLRSSIVEGCAILRHNRIAAPIFTGRIEPKNESASHGGDRTWQEQCAAGIAAPASGGGCLIVAIPDSVILANKRRIYRRNTSSVITRTRKTAVLTTALLPVSAGKAQNVSIQIFAGGSSRLGKESQP